MTPALFLLITAVSFLLPNCACGQCTLVFTVDSGASSLSFGGAVTEPVPNPIQPKHPDALIGFEGQLEGSLASAACPLSVDELLRQLEGASFETTPALGPLRVYPSSIQGSGLAELDLRDMSFNISVDPLAAAAASGPGTSPAGGWQYDTGLSAAMATGYVLVTSPLSPAPETVTLVGLESSSSSQVYASKTPEGLARLELRGLVLTFTSVYYGTLMGNPLKGVSDYRFEGSLVVEAALGCGAGCGPHGRCSAANATAPAGCECECGWAGDACDVPSGFCPRFFNESTATCPVAPAPATSPSPDPSVPISPCVPQECNARQQYNASTGRCECLPGWTGQLCDSCRTSQACASFYKDSGATCSADYTFSPHSQYKAYACSLEGTGLDDVIESNSFFYVCNTTAPSVVSLPAGQYCKVNFALKGEASIPIECKAYQCSFRANSTRVDCATTHCECKTACPNVQGILNSAEGKQVWMDCNPQTGQCTIEIQDFFVTFVAPCAPSECLVDSYSLEEGTYTVSTGTDYDAVIAAVPLMALVAVAGFLSYYLFLHRAHWGVGAATQALAMGAGAPTKGALAVLPLRSRPQVEELRFDHLSCSVPLRRGWLGGSAGRLAGFLAPSSWQRQSAKSVTAEEAGEGAGEASKGGMKMVLQNVSGVARRGELIGVLGPSGSGKTTLLALLTGSREDVGVGARAEGTVLLDGAPMCSKGRRQVAFVPQDDSLLSTLTVAECIMYSALLRLPAHLTPEEVQGQVWRVIEELGLGHVAGSRVGGQVAGRGISGGERRRVTIGMELVTDPAILILDEPTSGLDSYTALLLMKTLKQVAGAGRIVMLSFHQPSPSMFSTLDRAYLLANGRCVFSGSPALAEQHFAAHGLPCPAGSAVAEHMLQVVSDPEQLSQLLHSVASGGGSGSQKPPQGPQPRESGVGISGEPGPHALVASAAPGHAGELRLDGAAAVAGPGSEAGADDRGGFAWGQPGSTGGGSSSVFEKELEGGLGEDGSRGTAGAEASGGQLKCGGGGGAAPASGADFSLSAGGASRAAAAPRSLSRELAIVFRRTLQDILRNPSLLLLHWAMAVGMGVLMGAIFLDVGTDISGAQNRAGGLFFSLCYHAFTSLTTVDLLTAERRLVQREVRGGYYRPSSYLLAKATLDALLLRAIPAFLYSAPFYPMMGLQSGSSTVALFLMVLATFAVAVGALSLSVTVGCSTAGKASLVMNLILLISLLVGGFFVNTSSIPAWIRWLRYLSLFYYAYAALMINEVAQLSMDFVVEGYAVSNVKGLAFLDIIGIDASRLTRDVIVLDCLYAGFLLLAFGLLYLRMPHRALLRHRRRG